MASFASPHFANALPYSPTAGMSQFASPLLSAEFKTMIQPEATKGAPSTWLKVMLIGSFLITGSINTLTKKFQFETCGPSLDTPLGTANGCPSGQKMFNKPWTQNLFMFAGEALLFFLFMRRKRVNARDNQAFMGSAPTPFYVFLFPACCDVLGTGIGGVGMFYINASVWQMMRGSLILFTSLFSVVFLKKRLRLYNWLAIAVTSTGLLLVGASALLDGGSTGQSNVGLGIFFTVLSQAFAACQVVVEELFVKKHKCPPEQVVGSEGLWGIALMVVILGVMYHIPGTDAGSYENVLDSGHMVTHAPTLVCLILTYQTSICCFNFLGVTITSKLSAVHRVINDALRTAIVWGVQLAFHYLGFEAYGTTLTPHSWMQLLGFVFLVLGSLLYHAVIHFPCLTYPKPDMQDKPAVPPALPPVFSNNSEEAQDPNSFAIAMSEEAASSPIRGHRLTLGAPEFAHACEGAKSEL